MKRLFGPNPKIAGFALCVVVGQLALAAVLAGQAWWVILLAAYAVGAFAAHYLNVVIHECSHNLVFRSTKLNKACAILANLPGFAPSAVVFRHYHLLHHRFLGRRGLDADVPLFWEIKLIGNSRSRKLVWLLVQPLIYIFLHPLQVRRRIGIDGWLVANILVVTAVSAAMAYGFGWSALGYLALSGYFAIGPHPTGAHILQEHFIFEGAEETASYYGPVNAISINHGLHLEHHDFPNVPGSKLAAMRRIAPAYYANRFYHRSRFACLWKFVADCRITLDSRIIHTAERTPFKA